MWQRLGVPGAVMHMLVIVLWACLSMHSNQPHLESAAKLSQVLEPGGWCFKSEEAGLPLASLIQMYNLG